MEKSKKSQFNTALFRKRLESRLKEKNMTKKELAKRAGISPQSINNWINGTVNDYGEHKFTPPSVEKLKQVADALDCSLDYFVRSDMTCTTLTKQELADYTGLSDRALDCLHFWNDTKIFPDYINEIDTLNTILEYYYTLMKKRAFKGFSVFHFIGNFWNAHKFKRVLYDRVRYFNGKEYKDIKTGDMISTGSGKGEKIKMLCPPVNSKSNRGYDTSTFDLINSENENEVYYEPVSALYREFCKGQIINALTEINSTAAAGKSKHTLPK